MNTLYMKYFITASHDVVLIYGLGLYFWESAALLVPSQIQFGTESKNPPLPDYEMLYFLPSFFKRFSILTVTVTSLNNES